MTLTQLERPLLIVVDKMNASYIDVARSLNVHLPQGFLRIPNHIARIPFKDDTTERMIPLYHGTYGVGTSPSVLIPVAFSELDSVIMHCMRQSGIPYQAFSYNSMNHIAHEIGIMKMEQQFNCIAFVCSKEGLEDVKAIHVSRSTSKGPRHS